jgi:hypothetical protein
MTSSPSADVTVEGESFRLNLGAILEDVGIPSSAAHGRLVRGVGR